MCAAGDIILIDEYKHGCTILSRHSFVVVSDEAGKIKGASFDIICNVMSSFKSESHKRKKLSYGTNFKYTSDVSDVIGNDKEGYIKADQLYYFDKSKIKYRKIGALSADVFDALLDFIESLDVDDILDNL